LFETQFIEIERRMAVVRGGQNRELFSGDSFSFTRGKEVLSRWMIIMPLTVHFKMVKYIYM
jgi:hypothetical protein